MIVNLDNPTQIEPTPHELAKPVYEKPRLGWHYKAMIETVEDLGIVHHDVWGDSHKLKITIRLDDEMTTRGWPKNVCFWCPVSDSPRSKLSRFLRQLGLSVKIDTDCLVGMEIAAKIVWTTRAGDDRTFASVSEVSAVGTAMPYHDTQYKASN
jgi:hypothetical protein